MIKRIVFLAAIAIFFAEAWLFLVVGNRIGLTLSLGWILGSFVLGIILVRIQGVRMLFEIHSQLQQGVLPTREVLNGLAIIFGGLFLAIPGYLTDALGAMLLLPPIRAVMLFCVVRTLNNRLMGVKAAGCAVPPSEEVLEIQAQTVGKDTRSA